MIQAEFEIYRGELAGEIVPAWIDGDDFLREEREFEDAVERAEGRHHDQPEI